MDRPKLLLPRVGDVIAGRFRVDRELGAGAMGAVYRATDLHENRPVAVKVMDPTLGSDPTLEKRFENEAQLGRQLKHKHSIQIYDSGRLPNGLPYLAMEYLTGRTLAQAIKEEGAFEAERALRIGRQILESLTEAHLKTIIHRDIKPANVMIEDRDGQADFVKVLDFGIAKVFDASRVAHAIKTATGLKMGAPAYMSPERMSKKRELTPSSDLYSVAVVIGEMLKGEPLYGKRNSVQIFASQLSGEPIPFPETIRGTRLGAVLQKATRKDIEDRYQSTQEMLAAIDELLRHPKHMLAPAGVPIPAEQQGLSTPLLVAILVFLLVALAAVLLVLLT